MHGQQKSSWLLARKSSDFRTCKTAAFSHSGANFKCQKINLLC